MELTARHPLWVFREAHKLSQAQAAEMVGITQAMWSGLERGERYASPPVAARIARLTGIDKDRLIDFGDNRSETPWSGEDRRSPGTTKDMP